MSPRRHLRELISDRLTAAAEEIFRAFEKTIDVYEEQLERQRKLLEVAWKPEVKLQRIELSRPVVFDEQLCEEDRISSPEQEEPEAFHIKEEQWEVGISQEDEELVLKLKADTFMFTPDNEECGRRVIQLDPDQDLLSHHPPVSEECDQRGSNDAHCPLRLRDITVKPEIKTHHKELQQPNALEKEEEEEEEREEVLADQKCCDKERDSRLDRDGPQTLALKEDCHEISITPESEDDSVEMNPDHENNILKAEGVDWEDLLLAPVAKSRDLLPGSTTKKKMTVNQHTRSHAGTKQFSCKICGKCLSKSYHLKVHMRTHTGERPYFCPVCGKDFAKRSHLNYHMRIHTGEKPYICETCGRGFVKNYHLKRHMTTHTGERPFVCTYCRKSFQWKSHLIEHVKTHD